MTYVFEHWLNGKLQEPKTVEANSVSEAVSKLSETYKGVFKLKERK